MYRSLRSHVLRIMPKTNQTPAKRPITNLSTFIREIEKISIDWAPSREFDPWFRGHGNTNWPLVPSVHRPGNHEILEEDQYRHEFKLRAFPYLAGTAREPNTEWEWYFIMQHHGLPTRLLDWTRSALVALYFAVRDAPGDSDAAVWVLDPWELNRRIARKGKTILSPVEPRIQSYLPEPLSKRALPRNPIALEAPLNSNRISAQRGVFTLHGSTRKALNRYANLKDRLLKIEIARQKICLIKEQLRIVGSPRPLSSLS